jgi:antitoxin ParD1/3/4
MSEIEKLSIAVSPELATTLREAVEAGEYASAGEAVREALSEWRLRRAGREAAAAELGRLWDEGLASGPSADGEEAFERIRGRLAAQPGRTEP